MSEANGAAARGHHALVIRDIDSDCRRDSVGERIVRKYSIDAAGGLTHGTLHLVQKQPHRIVVGNA
jgi:hypothetical protein